MTTFPHRDLPLLVTVLAAVLACAQPAFAAPAAQIRVGASPSAASIPGEAIVRFEPGTTATERLAARRATGVELERSLRIRQAQVVEVDGSVTTAVRRLERRPNVVYAQPNYRYRALAVAPPNDTFFGDLWGLEDPAIPDPGVDALEAWATTRGAGQVIAIVDTGVALDHPDLQGNLWTGPGGIHGFDFVDDDSDPDDFDFHGTHVAGTAAATDGNGLGIAGVAPDAQIMAIRALDGDGGGSSADIGDGIAFAAQQGADVINLSLGGPAGDGDAFMSNAVDVANQSDAVVVAAAGNEDNDNDASPTMPCSLTQPNLICVAAVTRSGALAGFSNFGATSVDVGAPGTSILSAETDYGVVFPDGLDALTNWVTPTFNGATAWGTSAINSEGTGSATDSPPDGTLYANGPPGDFAESQLVKATPIDLTGQRGCRMHFDLRHQIEDPAPDGTLFDALFVGAVTGAPGVLDVVPFAGTSPSFASEAFIAAEVSISDVSGRDDVKPVFAMSSDESLRFDGAYVDDLELLCRTSSYSNASPPVGNYVTFQGTSMAAPHVAGVAALVRAADPGVPDTQVVDAIEAGGAPLASLSGFTATGRTVDADGAIAAALGTPNTSPPAGPPPQQQALVLSAPAKPDLGGARGTIRVSRRGVFRYSFKATPGLAGEALFRTRRKAVVSRRAHLTVGSTAFTVSGTGRVTVKVKLSKRKLRILRRNGRLLLNATVTVRNMANLSSRATKRLTLRPPRRR